ncbi:hypothetical protein VTL71DRAFT_4069 [Oculimacula yallundae]|uniref:Uncharacterized protein n=1 Tax=Oculimacula yallundae TaxID=86028 RepID=A0ABR4C4S3_9HELO
MTRAYPKPFGTKAPLTSPDQLSIASTTELEAQIQSSENINSRFANDSDESSDSSIDSKEHPTTSRVLRSATKCKRAGSESAKGEEREKKKSLRSAGAVELMFYKSGELVSLEDAKRRKCRGEGVENTENVLSDKRDGSGRGLQSFGTMSPEKGCRVDCSSADLLGKRKGSEEAHSGSLTSKRRDSGYASQTEHTPKRARYSSPTYRTCKSSPIKSQSEQDKESGRRGIGFAEGIRKTRTPSSSFESARNNEAGPKHAVDGKQDLQNAFRRRRSRSPPRDRDGSESSAESRYNCAETYGPAEKLDVPCISEHLTVKPSKHKRRDASLHTPTRSSPMLGKQPSQIIEIKATNSHSISYILITPPSSEAGDTVLESHHATSSDPLPGETESKLACGKDIFPLVSAPKLCTGTGKLPAKIGTNLEGMEKDDQDNEKFVLPPPLLPIDVAIMTEHA